jgi:L-ascorbate metabolism protein UlaG (beta-lactamase superfamily)
MNIKFINHASVMFDLGEVRILTDPWYQGLVFNDGWSLLNSGQNIGNFLGRHSCIT